MWHALWLLNNSRELKQPNFFNILNSDIIGHVFTSVVEALNACRTFTCYEVKPLTPAHTSLPNQNMPHSYQRSIFTIVRSSQTIRICVGRRPRHSSLVIHWTTKAVLLTGNIFSRHKNIFTQYQPSTLEIKFHIRDNFFDPGVLMQTCDKTAATLTQAYVVVNF